MGLNLDTVPLDNGKNVTPTWLPLTRRLATGAAILVYHGVKDADEAAFGTMHVPLDRLKATVRGLKRVATFAPLPEILSRQREGRSTKGLVAITFDDAYASVRMGLPFLFAESIPFTLFVVADRARTGRPFWWDRVEELITLSSAQRWRTFEDECGLPQAFRSGQPATMGPLRPLRQWILSEYHGRWPEQLEEPLDRLERDVGRRTKQRALTFDELDALASNPLVDLGAHSLTHPVLPLLPPDELRHEIKASVDRLRERYPKTLPLLAPPFGLYDERTVRMMQEERLTGCLTLAGTLLDDDAPAPLIPRFGMTSRHQPWKAVLYALGCWYRARPRRGAVQYPDLPSAGT